MRYAELVLERAKQRAQKAKIAFSMRYQTGDSSQQDDDPTRSDEKGYKKMQTGAKEISPRYGPDNHKVLC